VVGSVERVFERLLEFAVNGLFINNSGLQMTEVGNGEKGDEK
jgi:hypothetical protein